METERDYVPSQEELLEEMEAEKPQIELIDYWKIIMGLKDKNWSFRKIAEWLTARNVPVTHTQVYHFYNKYTYMRQLAKQGNPEAIAYFESEEDEYEPDEYTH